MHFSDINQGTGGKAGKFALVTGLHVLVAMGVIATMNAKTLSLPAMLEEKMVWIEPEAPPPAPPPEPPKPQQQAKVPDLVVPKTEVETLQPPPEQVIEASTEPVLEQASEPAQSETPPLPATEPSTNSGQMRSAVLADANGCAKPDYPVRAARNGETGTVTLALLVGADGRVQDSKIQSSSGSRDLDRAAVNALSLCKFQPAMNGGTAEAGWAQLAYVWSLE